MSATTTVLRALRAKSSHLFSQRLVALTSDQSTHTLTTGGLIHTDLLVVSRALCSFRRIKLPSGSRNAIKAALMQARRDASSEADIVQIDQDQMNRTMAGLWSWPSVETYADTGAAHISRSIPETLARQPMRSGRRLVACLEGVEGQVWEDGALLASRWWPDTPGQNQWVTFLRSARLKTADIDLALPPTIEVPWRLDLPLLRGAADMMHMFATPARLLVVIGTLFSAILLYNGAQYFRYAQTLQNLQGQIVDRKKVVSNVLAERNKAIQNLRSIDTMANIGSSTALLDAFAGVLEKVQGKEMYVNKLSLSDGQLEINITGESDTDGAALVKRLEGDDAIEQVSVNFKPGNQVEISARLEKGQKQ